MSKVKYGFTLKYIKHNVLWNEEQYMLAISNMEKTYKGTVLDYRFEKDSLDRLHAHGTLLARKGLRYTLYKVHYLHVHLDELKTKADEINWDNYINKDIYLDYMFQDIPGDQKMELNKHLIEITKETEAPTSAMPNDGQVEITI